MYINLVHRKTGEERNIQFGGKPLLEIKQVGLGAAASPAHYFVSVIAQTFEEIEFIALNFTNLPLPHAEAKEAIWTGDLAIFIILNYPVLQKDNDESDLV